MSIIRLIIFLALLFSSLAALANNHATQKPPSVKAYEECAVRVFYHSTKVSDVFQECEAEMDAMTAHLNDGMQEKIRQRAMAETQRALRAQNESREANDNHVEN